MQDQHPNWLNAESRAQAGQAPPRVTSLQPVKAGRCERETDVVSRTDVGLPEPSDEAKRPRSMADSIRARRPTFEKGERFDVARFQVHTLSPQRVRERRAN